MRPKCGWDLNQSKARVFSLQPTTVQTPSLPSRLCLFDCCKMKRPHVDLSWLAAIVPLWQVLHASPTKTPAHRDAANIRGEAHNTHHSAELPPDFHIPDGSAHEVLSHVLHLVTGRKPFSLPAPPDAHQKPPEKSKMPLKGTSHDHQGAAPSGSSISALAGQSGAKPKHIPPWLGSEKSQTLSRQSTTKKRQRKAPQLEQSHVGPQRQRSQLRVTPRKSQRFYQRTS